MPHTKSRKLIVSGLDLEPGMNVYLDTKNMPKETINPTGKNVFGSKRIIGPFKVLAKIGAFGFQLDVPESMRIHPVFHRSRLTVTTDECVYEKDTERDNNSDQDQENTPK